jgi:DNA-binding CsgD family transcriptional regulator/tetratricopeptide (TPR) repeat protein
VDTPPLSRFEVMARAAEVEALAGTPDKSVRLARAVIAEAEQEGGVRLALAVERLARYLSEDNQSEAAMTTYERAVELAEALPASPEVVRVLGSHARALVGTGRYEEARVLCERAIGLGEAAGAHSEVRRIRNTYGVTLAFQGDIEAGLEQLRAARARVVERTAASVVRPRPSRISEVVRGYADLAAILERAGQADEVADVSNEGARLARELGVQATWGNTLEVHGAVGRFQLGEWDEADRMTRRLLSGRLRGPAAAWLHLVRARLETGRGSFEDAAIHLEAAHALIPTTADPTLIGELAATTAELALWRGRLTDARGAVDEALMRLHAGEDQLPVVRLCWLGIRAEAERATAARVRRASGELAEAIETAAALRAEAIAMERTLESRARLAPRELRLYPALVHAEWSRATDTDDPELWAAAGQRASELRDPWLTAYTGWREAEARLGDRGARAQAAGVLRRALESATALGALPLRGEIEALARRARIDMTPVAPAEAAPARVHDRFGLTTRELEVLALVAEGRTNRQIADELFITEKTAGHHVSNLLAKLDAATRVEAAAIAHRLGLIEPTLEQGGGR